MTSTSRTFTLNLERVLNATREAVWEALTSADDVTKWFNPIPDADAEVHELDVRVGGALRISFRRPEGQLIQFFGVYTVVDPRVSLHSISRTMRAGPTTGLFESGSSHRRHRRIRLNRQFEKLAKLVSA